MDLPEYIHRLNEYKGHIETCLALKLLLLTFVFVRTTELRGATWGEGGVRVADTYISHEDETGSSSAPILPISSRFKGAEDYQPML